MSGLSDHELVFVTFPLLKSDDKNGAHIIMKDFNRADESSILDYLEMAYGVNILWARFKEWCFDCLSRKQYTDCQR